MRKKQYYYTIQNRVKLELIGKLINDRYPVTYDEKWEETYPYTEYKTECGARECVKSLSEQWKVLEVRFQKKLR